MVCRIFPALRAFASWLGLAVLLTGCVTVPVSRVWSKADRELSKERLVSAKLQIVDERWLMSAQPLESDSIYRMLRVVPASQPKEDIVIRLLPCQKVASFWEHKYFLLSAITLTIFPVAEKISCQTVLEIRDTVTNELKIETLEQEYTDSFGIIQWPFVGIWIPVLNGLNKSDSVILILAKPQK